VALISDSRPSVRH